MWKFILIATFTFFVNDVLGRPANDPIKINLGPSYKSTEKSGLILSMLQQGEEFINRLRNSIRLGRGRLVNSAVLARNIIAQRAEEAVSEAQNNIASIVVAKSNIIKPRSVPSYEAAPFANILPPKTRETVRLEEPKGQALFEYPWKHPVEGVLQSYLKPTPIVDGIKEHEKYGNSGDTFATVGRALVNGFESLSNLLNGVVEAPRNAAKKTSRGITEALNQLGSRLVGLQ